MSMLDEAQIRRGKLQALQDAGVDPYPATSSRTAMIGEVLASFEKLEQSGEEMTLAGRVMTTRVHGAMIFADLVDESGKMQIALKEDEIGAELFARFRDCIDPGDLIEATGAVFQTKRGERTLNVKGWNILAKALLPLPEKWHGLQDIEKRFRERELDLLSNPEVKQRFLVRSKLISALRSFLDARGFMEVETPILQAIPGGANARPFITHHNALDVDLYLRIAPELYLKRLIVGGFEKVYEIGRSFRNEGIDYAHNPEFTMFELYWAYADKDTFIAFLEELVSTIVREAIGEEKFALPWKKVTFRGAIQDACGIDIDEYRETAALEKAVRAKKLSVDFTGCVGIGECYDQLFKKTAREKMIEPTWVFDYPVELKPLTKRSPEDATKSACAQLVIQGAEIINAYYHELNDPIDQRSRFEEQQALREQGSQEAQPIDESFVRALEHGLPPTSGVGIGIDRLVAFLTDAPSLKEIILFPTLRPEHSSE